MLCLYNREIDTVKVYRMNANITLKQATSADKVNVYQWLFHSDHILDYILDKGRKIPSLEDFYNDSFPDYFFTGKEAEEGNCFLIMNNGKAIGAISYSAFHLKPGITELDIWLSSCQQTGQGYGVQALCLLKEKLRQLGFSRAIIRPAKHNIFAQKAYQKAGFIINNAPDLSLYYLAESICLYGNGDFGS